jgi:hypothetical protein
MQKCLKLNRANQLSIGNTAHPNVGTQAEKTALFDKKRVSAAFGPVSPI